MTKSKHFFHESAPDLLLDKIAEVNSLLMKVKTKSGENDSYKFWKSVCDVMKLSYDHMMELKWIHGKMELIGQENLFLKKYSRELSRKLQNYETIRELKVGGTLDETIARVDAYLKEVKNAVKTAVDE